MENFTKNQMEIVAYVLSVKDGIDQSTWAGGDDSHSCKLFLEWAEAHAGMIDAEEGREYFSPLGHHNALDASLWELRGHFLRGEFHDDFRL